MSSVVVKVTSDPSGTGAPSRVKVRSAVVNVVGSIGLEKVTPIAETGVVRGLVIGEMWSTVGGAFADWTVKLTDCEPVPGVPGRGP